MAKTNGIPEGLKEKLAGQDIEVLLNQMMNFREIIMMYECAIREIRTKLEVLNAEFVAKGKRNPIETIKSRVKSPKSIYEKAIGRGLEINAESITKNMHDIAGVRVICPFIEDIYRVAEMLTNQDDIKMITIKDYIQHPKDNGYRSLHIVVEVPIFLSEKKEYMKVEVQIRTIAMDFWAALEHQIHYKKSTADEDLSIERELKECADTIYETDKKMEDIRHKLDYVEESSHVI